MNIKMCGTKTCEKWRFLMRKGTKIALKPRATLWLFCEVLRLQPIGINRVLERDFSSLIIQYIIPRATLWLFCEVLRLQPIGINRALERDFSSLIIQYIILDKSSLWTGYWDCWRDLIAMHHFSRTDGFFSGYKSLEAVQVAVWSVCRWLL